MIRFYTVVVCLCLSACVVAPEPPVASSNANSPQQEKNTEMRDAIQAPIQKAEGVEDQVLEGAEQQAKQMEEAEG